MSVAYDIGGLSALHDGECAFDYGSKRGPWLLFLPSWMTVGVVTYISAVLAIIVGVLMYQSSAQKTWVECFKSTDSPGHDCSCWFKVVSFPGDIWIRALKCLVTPLIMSMIITLPEKLEEIGKIGTRLILLMTFTSSVAAIEGLLWANWLEPGKGLKSSINYSSEISADKISEIEVALTFFESLIPENAISILWHNDILSIIIWFGLYGLEICACPEEFKQPLLNFTKAILRSTLKLLSILMWFTPIAMFSIISCNIAKTTELSSTLLTLGKYVSCQLLGQACHLLIFHFGFYFITTGNNPLRYLWRIQDAPIAAIITSSSVATMPVTIRVNREVGNDERLVQFSIPVGAGMNMDGTGLGFPIMVLFTAQLGNVEVSWINQVTIAILSVICSVGAAPIPNASLVFLTLMFSAGKIPLEVQGIGYGLISTVDWMIDRLETAQNVTSDSFLCGILNHYYNGHSGCLSCCLARIFTSDVDRGDYVEEIELCGSATVILKELDNIFI